MPAESEEEWTFHNVAILKPYSEPNVELFQASSQVLAASTLLDEIMICNVKAIWSVVAMVPRWFALPSGLRVEGNFFCMVEKPGLDISDLGVPYSVYSAEEEVDEGNDVE